MQLGTGTSEGAFGGPFRSFLLLFNLVLGLGLIIGPGGCGRSSQALVVSAAADLMPAFTEIGAEFEKRTGIKVTFNFGSTGQLAQQIERGAPVDLFAAANQSYIDELESKGLIIPETKYLYAVGRIAVWTKPDFSPVPAGVESLADPRFKRLAIANPDHAPYGASAREALQSSGLWEKVLPKIVYGENIRQTLQYAETGNADAAIVALSLCRRGEGRWVVIPQELHRPLNQTLAVIKGSPRVPEARKFAGFIAGDEGRVILGKYGFTLPAGGEKRGP